MELQQEGKAGWVVAITATAAVGATVIANQCWQNKREISTTPVYKDLPIIESYLTDAEKVQFGELREQFGRFTDDIRRIQEKHKDKIGIRRGFHAKGHGCLKGRFQVLNDRPVNTRFGIFADGAPSEYPVWIRYSNARSVDDHDGEKDFKGLGIKVLGVTGDKLLKEKQYTTTQDFLLTNKPRATTSDAKVFMEFGRAASRGKAAILGFIARHPVAGWHLIQAQFKHASIGSLVNQTFWSGTPYQLGSRTVKYIVTSCDNTPREVPKDPNRDYLKEDVADLKADLERALG